jgi:hypothetical protein
MIRVQLKRGEPSLQRLLNLETQCLFRRNGKLSSRPKKIKEVSAASYVLEANSGLIFYLVQSVELIIKLHQSSIENKTNVSGATSMPAMASR